MTGSGSLILTYREDILTEEGLSTFLEENPGVFERGVKEVTLSKTTEAVKIENPSSGRSQEVDYIQASGNMNEIYPDTLMMGSLASKSDTAGCVISKKTAQALFGTYEVVNSVIKCGDIIYYVRGILDVEEPLCMVQGNQEISYSRVCITYDQVPASVVLQMMQPFLPHTYLTESEGDLYASIARIFLWLPIWTVTLMFAFQVPQILEAAIKKEWMHEIAMGLFLTALFGIICVLILMTFQFTDDYIPSAWSDFDFWQNLFKNKWEDFRNLYTQSMSYRDKVMLGNLWKCAACQGVVSIYLIGIIPGYMKNKRGAAV